MHLLQYYLCPVVVVVGISLSSVARDNGKTSLLGVETQMSCLFRKIGKWNQEEKEFYSRIDMETYHENIEIKDCLVL